MLAHRVFELEGWRPWIERNPKSGTDVALHEVAQAHQIVG